MVSISKSRMGTFDRCQQLYYYKYEEKIEEEETEEMSAGTKFHEWSANLDNKLKDLKDENIIKEYLDALLLNPTRTEWEKYYINFELSLLEKCVDVKKDKWRDYFIPRYVEFFFEKEIGENKYRCICDRIYNTFSDELLLVEIKTGIADLEAVRRELTISKICIDAAINVEIKWFGILNPNLKITQTEKIKKVSMTYTKKAIDKFIAVVNSGIYAKNTWFCGTCAFSEKCYNFTMFK